MLLINGWSARNTTDHMYAIYKCGRKWRSSPSRNMPTIEYMDPVWNLSIPSRPIRHVHAHWLDEICNVNDYKYSNMTLTNPKIIVRHISTPSFRSVVHHRQCFVKQLYSHSPSFASPSVKSPKASKVDGIKPHGQPTPPTAAKAVKSALTARRPIAARTQ